MAHKFLYFKGTGDEPCLYRKIMVMNSDHADFFIDLGGFETQQEAQAATIKKETKPTKIDADKDIGKIDVAEPGSLEWHNEQIDGAKKKDVVADYVKATTGQEMKTGGMLGNVKSRAKKAIKKHLDAQTDPA